MSHGSDTCIITAQLSETCDASSFKELIASSEYDFRFSCGVNKPVCRLQYSDKEKIIDAMRLHYSVLASLAELEQLRRGLSIHMLMESSPRAIRKAFEPSQTKISTDFLQDLFVPLFSPKGSNRRATEEALIMTWIGYLQCLEGI